MKNSAKNNTYEFFWGGNDDNPSALAYLLLQPGM